MAVFVGSPAYALVAPVDFAQTPLTWSLGVTLAERDPELQQKKVRLLALYRYDAATQSYITVDAVYYDYELSRLYIHRYGQSGVLVFYKDYSTSSPTTLEWITFVSVGNNTYSVYINGEEAYSGTVNINEYSDHITLLSLGLRPDGAPDDYTTAGVRCLAIWNTEIKFPELQAAFSFGFPSSKPDNLLHYWPLGTYRYGTTPLHPYAAEVGGVALAVWDVNYIPPVAYEPVNWATFPEPKRIPNLAVISGGEPEITKRPSIVFRRRRMLVYLNKADAATAKARRVYFHLVGADGITPVIGETGTPEISVDGGPWTTTGINALVSIGNGRYYAELTLSFIASLTPPARIETRYKSVNTAECFGDSVLVAEFSPFKTNLGASDLATCKTVADKLDTMLETSGTDYRFTADGLVNAGGWTSAERQQIRRVLGVTGAQADPDPTGIVPTMAAVAYWADIEAYVVSATENRICVRWYANMSPVTASNVRITVREPNGNALLADQLATSNDGGYSFLLVTGGYMNSGQAYIITVSGTVDGQVRSSTFMVKV